MTTRPEIEITFDGGCSPNPGKKYGSYEVRYAGKVFNRVSRVELGYGTNNEAEFDIAILALQWVEQKMNERGKNLSDYNAVLRTDSKIVASSLKRFRIRKKKHCDRMLERADKCMAILLKFHNFRTEWNGRALNVALFGH